MLYVCGSNGKGQLGLGHFDDVNCWTPARVDPEPPYQLAGGGNHTVVVDAAGTAFITKNGEFTKLAHPEGRAWKHCGAGWAFTVLVDEDNTLWTSGSGSKGELGRESATDSDALGALTWTPAAPVVAVKCGLAHTVVSLANGELYGWGASRKGQAGRPDAVLMTPTRFDLPSLGPNHYAVGRDFTAVLHNDTVRILGNTRMFGDRSELPAPGAMELMSGWSSIVLLPTFDAYGNSSHNQLDVKRGKLATLGSEHGVSASGLLKNGLQIVKTWGWGEHGNCPPDLVVSKVSAVYAGCATSFFEGSI